MNTLSKILKQDLIVSTEGQKLFDLHRKYVTENQKYEKGNYVSFFSWGIEKIGVIQSANFRSDHKYTGVVYTVLRVTKKGVKSKSDNTHYYIPENKLNYHEIKF